MYFPYLRGRQFELLALSELSGILSQADNVIPIIEPVKATSINAFRRLARNRIPFIIILNPTVGEFQDARGRDIIENQIVNGVISGYDNFYLGILISANTELAEIQSYLQQYPNHQKAIIHRGNYRDPNALLALLNADPTIAYYIFSESKTSAAYRDSFLDRPRVILRDGFTRQTSNAAYDDSDLFSDIHSTYTGLGFQGFGDYLTIGDEYREGGGLPSVVAIHLTYPDGGNVHVGHFISDPTSKTRANIAGKFSEALGNLIDFVNRNGMASRTMGIRDFEDLHIRQHFPNLGPIKKISMKHHIELISSLL